MKKGLKRLVALVLSFSMVLGSAALIFANEKPTVNYVSIGASNTNGYGLVGYIPEGISWENKDEANIFGYMRVPKGCYPDLFAKYLSGGGIDTDRSQSGVQTYIGPKATVNLSQMAMSSMRVEEIRVLLDDSYAGDDYTSWRFTGGENWFCKAVNNGVVPGTQGERNALIAQIRSDYQNSVKDADYITLDIGTNNFGVYLSNQILDDYYACDFNYIDPKYADKYDDVKSTIKDIFGAVISSDSFDISDLDRVLDPVVYAVLGFCYNFDKVIERIVALNESDDLNLIVIGIQNILDGIDVVYEDLTIPFGDIMQAVIDIANTYMLIGSPYRNCYDFVDLHNIAGHKDSAHSFLDEIEDHIEAFEAGNYEPLSANMMTCFELLDEDIAGEVADIEENIGTDAKNAACEALAATINWISHPYSIDLTQIVAALINGTVDDVANGPIATMEYCLGEIMREAVVMVYEKSMDIPGIINEVNSMLNAVDNPMKDELVRGMALFQIKTGIGNSFFSHPSELGHQQITEEIIKTIESDNAQYIHSQGDYYLALGGKTALGQGLSKGNKSYVQLIADELGFDAEHTLSKGTKKLSWTNAVSYIKANEAAIKKASLITYNPDMAGMISEAGRELILGGGNLGDYVDPEIMSFVDDLLDKAYALIDEYITNGEAISNELDKLVAGLEPELKSLVYDVLYENETVASILGGIKQETVDYLLDLCLGYVREILGSVQKAAGKLTAKLVDTIATTAKRIVYVAVAYCAESSKAVGQIISYNPSATVLLIGMYNPLRNLEIGLGSTSIDLGNFLEYIIRLTDDYGVKIAKKVNNNKFAFVDVSSARTGNEEIHFDVLRIFKYFSYMTSICKNAYVSADGHADIKNAVMACLEVKDAPLMLFAPVRPAAEEPEQIEETQEIEKTEPAEESQEQAPQQEHESHEESQEQAPQQEHESLEEKQIEETVIIGDAAKLVSGGMKLAKGIAKLAVNNAKRVLGFFFGR